MKFCGIGKLQKAFWAAMFPLAGFGAWQVGVMLADNEPPIRFDEVSALDKTIPQGASLEVRFRVFRFRVCDSEATRRLVDSEGTVHNIPAYTTGLERFAGKENYVRTVDIPQSAAIGPAQYLVEIAYYCNPFHRLGWPIIVDAPPARFEITPATSIVPFGLPAFSDP